jgi:hypothetical protein
LASSITVVATSPTSGARFCLACADPTHEWYIDGMAPPTFHENARDWWDSQQMVRHHTREIERIEKERASINRLIEAMKHGA